MARWQRDGVAMWRNGNVLVWQKAVAAMRATHRLVHVKCRWTFKIPFLLARLFEPGVKFEAIMQYESYPTHLHHRVSFELLDPSSPLRGDVDALDANGIGATPRLEWYVAGIRSAPLDDCVAEGPHAAFTRICNHSRRGTWAWRCATQSLKDNLGDYDEMLAGTDVNFQYRCWDCYTSVLRFNDKVSGRRSRSITDNSHSRQKNLKWNLALGRDPFL